MVMIISIFFIITTSAAAAAAAAATPTPTPSSITGSSSTSNGNRSSVRTAAAALLTYLMESGRIIFDGSLAILFETPSLCDPKIASTVDDVRCYIEPFCKNLINVSVRATRLSHFLLDIPADLTPE